MTHAIPSSMRIGKYRYSILPNPWLTSYGRVFYDVKSIDIRPRDAKGERESLWHETTHAILHEMQHPLRNDEKFVTQFARLLSRAIDSARFE